MLDRNAILTRLTKAREDIDFVIDALWCDSEPGQGATFGIRLSVVGGGPVTENVAAP